MSEENYAVIEETEQNDVDIKTKVQGIIFKTLKNSIKGHIYVTVEEKNEDNDYDSVFTNIKSFGINYTYRLALKGKTYEMIAENDDYAVTLAGMIIDNFKEFLNTRFFITEKPVYKKNRVNKGAHNE